jgi:hypothetical protein
MLHRSSRCSSPRSRLPASTPICATSPWRSVREGDVVDALTQMYADAWSQLPVEMLALVVVPGPRPPVEPDAEPTGGG